MTALAMYFQKTQSSQSTDNYYFSLEPISKYNHKKRSLLLKEKFGSDMHTKKYEILQDMLKKSNDFFIYHQHTSNVNFIFKALNNIISDEYFGSNSNRKIFYCTVKKIIRRSKHECIYRNELYEGYDYTCMTWLKFKNDFVTVNEWVFNNVVKPIITSYFFAMKDINTNYGLKLIPKRKWFSFQSRIIRNMIKAKHIQPLSFTPTCIRGKLSIIMKKDINDDKSYRPIVLLTKTPKGDLSKQKLKSYSCLIRSKASAICFTKTKSIFENWSNFVKSTGFETIYGAVVDIKNAFSSITIKKMSLLLDVLVQDGVLPSDRGNYIKAHIRNQNVIYQFARKGVPRIGRWHYGLLQGDTLSSALFQLYMSVLDRRYLMAFSRPNSLLHRSTDDYFFCSTDPEEVKRFMKIMTNAYDINPNKAQTSIHNNNNNALSYHGNLFIMDNKEVKYHYKFKKGNLMKHKCRFWNLNNQVAYDQLNLFIQNSLAFPSNNHFFGKMYINTIFNSYATVLDNFFEGMIYIAFKFDAAVIAAYRENISSALLIKIIKSVYKNYANKCKNILEKHVNDEEKRIRWKSYFYKLSIRAFQLVLKKRKWLYDDTLKELNVMYKSHIIRRNNYLNMQRYRKIPDAFKNLKIGTCIRYKKKM